MKKRRLMVGVFCVVTALQLILGTNVVSFAQDAFSNVKEYYSGYVVSQAKGFTDFYTELPAGKTNVYPITVKNTTKYKLGMTDETNGAYEVQLINQNGIIVYQDDGILRDEGWYNTIYLTKGDYYLKILSREEIGLDYEVFLKPNIYVLKKSYDMTLESCYEKKLKPGLGSGNWKTKNSKVVSISSKTGRSIKIRARKAGKTKVIYTTKYGSKVTYTITVPKKDTYPLDKGYFKKDNWGGLKPHLLIANTSNKKIIYIHFTISVLDGSGRYLKDVYRFNERKNIEYYTSIGPWEKQWFDWNTVFTNADAKKMVIESMKIVYADKSTYEKEVNLRVDLK